jgi:hypothetical protein
MRKLPIFLSSLMLSIGMVYGAIRPAANHQVADPAATKGRIIQKADQNDDQSSLYFPLVMNGFFVRRTENQRVYMPYFPDQIKFDETAVFWFGKVNLTENYADVRVGYTRSELFVHVAVFDRLVWYNTSPSTGDLEDWDAVTVYLDKGGNTGETPTSGAYQFVAQVRPDWKDSLGYQKAYQGDGSGWKVSNASFSTESGYRGNPNDTIPDSGWRVTYRIPFSNLGSGGTPGNGEIWGLGVAVHDRDDAAGTPIGEKTWPTGIKSGKSSTWGELAFGLLAQKSVESQSQGSVTIRHGLNGAKVVDGEVGGHTVCGKGLDRFTEWGDKNYGTDPNEITARVNIQNQYDVSDFPCFSKFFITFPLDLVPAGKVIQSAKLTLYQFGNAGGGKWGSAPGSWIQVFTISEDWLEDVITWNNAPQAVENISRSWVPWLESYPGPQGIPREWDVTGAVLEGSCFRGISIW